MRKLYALIALLLFGFHGFASVGMPVIPTEESSLACATITLTSSPSTINQTVCLNTPIMVVSFLVGNGGTGATVIGLPPGVTSSFAGGVFTISGTPIAAGVYSYTVTTTGGECASSLGGTITVNPNASVFLASSAGTSMQTVCLNTMITPIMYLANNGATGAFVLGLPAGVTSSFNAVTQTMIISGAPTVSGTFNYVVTTSGGCSSASQTGTITVNPGVSLSLSSPASTSNQIVCLNTPITPVTYVAANGATNAIVTGLPSGVNGNFNAATQTLTLSGVSSFPGTYAYTVATIGGCSSSSLSGLITVVPDSQIALQSAGADDQLVCVNEPIVNIVYGLSDGAVGATAIGLPTGIASTSVGGTVVISGAPTLVGTFSYTVTTVGGCGSASMSGTITVLPNAAISLSYTATGNSVTFDWNDVPGAAGYLYSYSINGGALINGVISFPGPTEFTLDNLPSNSVVVFNVTAQGVCADGTLTTGVLSAPAFEKMNIAAYPNPVIDVLHLQGDRAFSKVQVFNPLGKLMSESDVQSENPAIDLSALAPGIYFVKATANELQQTFSVVKQ